MAVYTVHEPAGGMPASLAERLDQVRMIKDGFSWPAFILGPFWLARHRLWKPLAIWLGAVLGLSLVMSLIWGADGIGTWIWLGAALILGFEAGELRRSGLEEQGYRQVTTISGASEEECEIKLAHLAATVTPPAQETASNNPS